LLANTVGLFLTWDRKTISCQRFSFPPQAGEIMPVLAYIASPRSGSKKKLLRELNALQHCEAFAADNADILILVTDTPDGETEEKLRKHLSKLESLESLSMTFGYNDEL
jgi:nitrate reductase NapAB chaperone NapD